MHGVSTTRTPHCHAAPGPHLCNQRLPVNRLRLGALPRRLRQEKGSAREGQQAVRRGADGGARLTATTTPPLCPGLPRPAPDSAPALPAHPHDGIRITTMQEFPHLLRQLRELLQEFGQLGVDLGADGARSVLPLVCEAPWMGSSSDRECCNSIKPQAAVHNWADALQVRAATPHGQFAATPHGQRSHRRRKGSCTAARQATHPRPPRRARCYERPPRGTAPAF